MKQDKTVFFNIRKKKGILKNTGLGILIEFK